MNRKLTKQEKEWLIKGLEYSQTEEYLKARKRRAEVAGKSTDINSPEIEFYLKQIENLRVIKKCECGDADCHTVRFQHSKRDECRTLVVTQIEDGRMLIIDIDKETKMLAGLEVI